MSKITIFQSNRSQAIRLTKDVAFPEGQRQVIVPSNALWDDFFEAPSVDLGTRQQPHTQDRQG